jgi:hypothetical protein
MLYKCGLDLNPIELCLSSYGVHSGLTMPMLSNLKVSNAEVINIKNIVHL